MCRIGQVAGEQVRRLGGGERVSKQPKREASFADKDLCVCVWGAVEPQWALNAGGGGKELYSPPHTLLPYAQQIKRGRKEECFYITLVCLYAEV